MFQWAAAVRLIELGEALRRTAAEGILQPRGYVLENSDKLLHVEAWVGHNFTWFLFVSTEKRRYGLRSTKEPLTYGSERENAQFYLNSGIATLREKTRYR